MPSILHNTILNDASNVFQNLETRAQSIAAISDVNVDVKKRSISTLAWSASDFPDESHYIEYLDDQDIAEIDHALVYFKSLGLDGRLVQKENFPLNSLGRRLEKLVFYLQESQGFFGIRGLDLSTYTHEDNIIIYLGVSSYIGSIRGQQNENGDIFIHIRDNSRNVPKSARNIRQASKYTDMPLHFHSDRCCNIIALQCRGIALRGGNHVLASSAMIYQELFRTQPEVVNTLAKKEWPIPAAGSSFWDPHNPQFGSILYEIDDQIILNVPDYPPEFRNRQNTDTSLPTLNIEQVSALEALELVASSHQLRIDMKPGDIYFVNNLSVLHSRESFHDDEAHSRYLIRLWLKNDKVSWRLSATMQADNDEIYWATNRKDRWNLVAESNIRYIVKRKLGCA